MVQPALPPPNTQYLLTHGSRGIHRTYKELSVSRESNPPPIQANATYRTNVAFLSGADEESPWAISLSVRNGQLSIAKNIQGHIALFDLDPQGRMHVGAGDSYDAGTRGLVDPDPPKEDIMVRMIMAAAKAGNVDDFLKALRKDGDIKFYSDTPKEKIQAYIDAGATCKISTASVIF